MFLLLFDFITMFCKFCRVFYVLYFLHTLWIFVWKSFKHSEHKLDCNCKIKMIFRYIEFNTSVWVEATGYTYEGNSYGKCHWQGRICSLVTNTWCCSPLYSNDLYQKLNLWSDSLPQNVAVGCYVLWLLTWGISLIDSTPDGS